MNLRKISLSALICSILLIIVNTDSYSINSENIVSGCKLKVGVYNFKPLVFIDEQTGEAQGFFPDILNYIAEKEGWEIEYVQGSWSECLSRVQNGELDLQPAIAHSKKREDKLDFSNYLILDWAALYKHKDSTIQTIFDLEGKTVSVIKSGITTDEFKKLTAQFSINCKLFETDENIENLKAVHNRKADAGISPNIYGTTVEGNYNIERTSIVFAPIRLGFAVKKGMNPKIISILNNYIAELKTDKNSIYYKMIEKWTFGYGRTEKIPKWLLFTLSVFLLFFAVLVVFSIILNRAVKHKTKELVRINDALETSKERYKILFEQAMHDITERRLAEAALRQSEEKFRVIFERAPIGIILSDSQSVVVDSNKHFADIFEAEKEQYYGMNLLERIPDCPVRQNLINALNDYELHIYEGIHVSVITNKQKYISISSQKISQNLIISIIINMTEHKRAEEENKKLQRQLLQSHKMESIGRLAGGVAHDFNNMLGVIIGYTDILLDDSDINHPFYEGLCAIRQAAMRSSDLTKQLLAFARKQAVNPKKLNINSAVEDMLSMVKRVIGENIELILIKDEAIKDVKIDPTQIDQILVNLCVNAKDAVQTVNKSGGKITIETSNVIFSEEYCSDNSEALPGSYVMLAVSDNGCGMNKETLSFIFDPFFTTKDINKGTGLGLASVYGIVKQNKGFINVYSELNQGTAFKIYLPVYQESDRDLNIKAEKEQEFKNQENYEQESKSQEIEKAEGNFKIVYGTETILLVEDEVWLLELCQSMLERLGYKVLSAAAPKKAVEITSNKSEIIDLVITDVIMPEMNGKELIEKLRSINPALKYMFMSGYTANVIAHHGVLDKNVNFIQKPFSIYELSVKIRNTLEKC